MASQTDKKEEFRKYLEKGKVLGVLTTVLTDLFEMENKPEDPLRYLHQRFGENLHKTIPFNGPQKDVSMSDAPKKPYNPSADQEMIPAQPQSVNTAPNHLTAPLSATEQPVVSVEPPASAPVPIVPITTAVAPVQLVSPTPPAGAVSTAPIPPPINPAAASAPQPQAVQQVTPVVSQSAAPTQSTSTPVSVVPTQPQQPSPPVQSTAAPAVTQNPAPVQ